MLLSESLALLCRWLDDCGAAAHALLEDPDDATAVRCILTIVLTITTLTNLTNDVDHLVALTIINVAV